MSTEHILAINDHYYEAKLFGDKLFEIRLNDRGFQKGDTVRYTTDEDQRISRRVRTGTWEITYVISYMQKENYVVFGERRLKED